MTKARCSAGAVDRASGRGRECNVHEDSDVELSSVEVSAGQEEKGIQHTKKNELEAALSGQLDRAVE